MHKQYTIKPVSATKTTKDKDKSDNLHSKFFLTHYMKKEAKGTIAAQNM